MNGLAMVLAVIAVLLYGGVVTAQQGQLYIQYKVAPFQASGDVFCPVAGYGLPFSPWAEYFGGGCEGRQCRTAYGGQTIVLHYRCRPGLLGRFRGCRAQEDVSFPHCCLPVCNDATYTDTFF